MKNAIRMDGLTLSVKSVRRSLAFYAGKLDFKVVVDASPDFAMVRVGGPRGGTIGLLSREHTKGAKALKRPGRAGIHVELSTNNLDALYAELKKRGVQFEEGPHDEPWERSMHAYDPDGYTVEFAQAKKKRLARE